MTTINITQFTGYSSGDFLHFLKIENPRLIEIILPRQFDNTEPDMIWYDFLKAAYAGQLLSRISEEFLYNLPNPEQKDNFRFLIVTNQWPELASVLTQFLHSFTDDDFSPDFDVAAVSFLDGMPEDEALACSCYVDMLDEL